MVFVTVLLFRYRPGMIAPMSVLLLTYLFVLLPWGVYKSVRMEEAQRASRKAAQDAGRTTVIKPMTPARIYVNTLINMGLLLVLAYLAARQAGVDLWRVPRFGMREWIACVVWFVASVLVSLLGRAWRKDAELREMPMVDLVPRSRNDWLAFIAVAIAAGICEEAAYRGMGFDAVRQWISLVPGAAPLAVPVATVLLAAAFAFAHLVQGNKSAILVFVMALLTQALVLYTGTLIGAMVGHALLDIVTAYRSRQLVRRLEATAIEA